MRRGAERSGRSAQPREIELLTASFLPRSTRRAGSQDRRCLDVAKAVAGRITDSIARIRKEHPGLALHLANNIRLGTFCCYAPEKAPNWRLYVDVVIDVTRVFNVE